MKKISLLFFCLVSVLLLSCNKEKSDINIAKPGDGGIQVLTVDAPGETTKVGFNNVAADGLKLTWEVNDTITVFDVTGPNLGNFRCALVDAVTKKATFVVIPESGPNGVTPSLTDGDSYTAVYPASTAPNLTLRNGGVKNILSSQTQGTNSLDHLNKSLFMKSSFTAGGSALSFTYEISIINITFPWSSSPLPNKLTFADGDKSYTLTHSTTFQSDSDSKYRVFFCVLPNSGTRKLIVSVQNGVYADMKTFTKASISNTFTAGSIYRSEITAYDTPPAPGPDYIEDGVNFGPSIIIDGLKWAPVNLGYKKAEGADKGYPFGKLFQWGRKMGQGYYTSSPYDGGPYQDASYPSSSADPATIVGALTANGASTNPDDDTFYKAYSDDDYSWLVYSGQSAFDETTDWMDLTGFGEKVGNPCPDGWRVPTYDELDALRANYSSWISTGTTGPTAEVQRGRYFSGSTSYSVGVASIFLPAAGDRLHNGDPESRGYVGLYWSSTPGGSNDLARSLFFFDETVDMYKGSRAYGFSVRCVQD